MTVERITLEPALDLDAFLDRGGARGSDELVAEAGELFAVCGRLVHPKALLRETEVQEAGGGAVVMGGERFESRCLAANLSGLDRAFAYIATCGTELEGIARGRDGLACYWVDVIKELALEAVIAETNRRVAERFGSAGVASMNPGSAEVDVWPLEQQRPLFRLLGDPQAEIGVILTESLLMIPNKSVSGVFFPSRAGWVSCQVCTRAGCIGRRASYRGAPVE